MFTAIVEIKIYLSQLFRVVVAVENSCAIARIDSLQELSGMSVVLKVCTGGPWWSVCVADEANGGLGGEGMVGARWQGHMAKTSKFIVEHAELATTRENDVA